MASSAVAAAAPEKFTFFYRKHSPFSNFHPCSFTIDGNTYNCVEQFYQYSKAMKFGDIESAECIMRATEPFHMKRIGKHVFGFDKRRWQTCCWSVMYQGVLAKFTQNQHLQRHLIKTEGTTLVEAAPNDTLWGIGLNEGDPMATNRSTWKGKNWMGEILTQVREYLLKQHRNKSYYKMHWNEVRLSKRLYMPFRRYPRGRLWQLHLTQQKQQFIQCD